MARLLVIDDEPDVRWLLRLSLERVGHEVLLAEDGLRGVAMAQRQRPDLILLDLMMPVMDGYGVLDVLRKDDRTANVPILMLTAKALDDDQRRCEEAGATMFLTKPFEPEDLAGTIEDLLGRDQAATESA
jgi:two-component system response regulator RpaA